MLRQAVYSEIFNQPEFLTYDRNQRRIGIGDAAEKSLKMMETDSVTNEGIDSLFNRGECIYKGTGLQDHAVGIQDFGL